MHLCGSKGKSYTRGVYSKNSHPPCQRDDIPRDTRHRYALNVCVPPKFTRGTLNPHVMLLEGGAVGRGLGHVGGALVKGMSAPTKGTPQSSLAPSFTEKEPHPRFDLRGPATRTVSDTFLLFRSYAARSVCLQ